MVIVARAPHVECPAKHLNLAGKEYVGIAHFHGDVSEADIRRAFSEFTGVIMQTPPIRSAVKRQARPRTVYELGALEIEGRDVLFRTQVEGGTYIRKLVHDIGAYLRIGAHMGDLRRTKAGSFDESTLVILHDLRDALEYWKETGDENPLRGMLQPPERAVEHIARVVIDREAARAVCHGAYLAVPGVLSYSDFAKDEPVLLFSEDLLIGYGTALMSSEDLAHMEKGLLIATDAIIRDASVFEPKEPERAERP